MKIIEFLILNLSDILFVIATIAIVIYSLVTNKLEYLKADIFSLITEAEEIYGAKTGRIKLMYVIRKIYVKMPVVLKLFITEKQMEKIVEKMLTKVKESWTKNNLKNEEQESPWQ